LQLCQHLIASEIAKALVDLIKLSEVDQCQNCQLRVSLSAILSAPEAAFQGPDQGLAVNRKSG
jgi:hypothetical protein